MHLTRFTCTHVILFIALLCVAAPAFAQPTVDSLTLINADTNAPIAAFDPLTDGATLYLPGLPTTNLNIRANTTPSVVGSVRFGLDGNPNYRVENVAPYALEGDNSGNYNAWTPGVGAHTVTATAFDGSGAGGNSGPTLSITINVTDAGSATPTPGPSPTPAPPPAAHTYIAENGIVAVEVESAAPADDWTPQTSVPGYTGESYYHWTGPDLFASPGSGVLTYNIQISDPGTYRLRIRNYHDNPDGTESNDCFVRMDSGPWLKVWSPTVAAWNWESNFDFAHDNKPPATFNLDAGTHTFQIAGRSNGFRIDRFHLFLGSVTDPVNPDRPQSETAENATVTGELKQWHRVTLTFDGPNTGEADGVNPFLNYRMNVHFSNGNRTFVVPGFYAADGNAAETSADTGNQWRAHFTPDATGTWNYWTSFKTGSNVSVSLVPTDGQPVSIHGLSGSFTIGPTDKAVPDNRARGLLQYVNGHHLQFAETGEYYLKGGADSPEDVLGYFEFDGTYDTGGIINNFLHEFAPHVQDWNAGDPSWQGGKGKALIGGLNYLASQGVNSVYFLTYNIDGGDGANTWPWTSHTERYRFDVSKLDQWEIAFAHMDRLGIQLHVVTQETENDGDLGGGNLDNTRKLYYRELIARFAHHLALQWNLGEENDNSDAQRIAFADYIRALDPYDHPITVHTYFGQASTYYNGLLGQPNFEATSIQGNANQYNAWAIELRERSALEGRPWAIYGDEQGPPVDDEMNNLEPLRQNALWGNLIGGGAGVEWYFGYQGANFGDMQSEDWRVAEPLWIMTRHAVEFFQQHLPFQDMAPDNGTVIGDAFCLAKPGAVYAIYLPFGNTTALTVPAGEYSVRWYDPRNGGVLQAGSVTSITGPGTLSIGYPPNATTEDWTVLVMAQDDNATMSTR